MVQFLQLFNQAIKLVSNSSYHKFAVAMLTYRWLVERIDLVSPIPCFYLWSVSWFWILATSFLKSGQEELWTAVNFHNAGPNAPKAFKLPMCSPQKNLFISVLPSLTRTSRCKCSQTTCCLLLVITPIRSRSASSSTQKGLNLSTQTKYWWLTLQCPDKSDGSMGFNIQWAFSTVAEEVNNYLAIAEELKAYNPFEYWFTNSVNFLILFLHCACLPSAGSSLPRVSYGEIE